MTNPDLVDSYSQPAEPLLTVDEQAARLGLDRKKLYRLAAEHGLPVIRVGRSVFFRQSLTEQWLASRTSFKDAA